MIVSAIHEGLRNLPKLDKLPVEFDHPLPFVVHCQNSVVGRFKNCTQLNFAFTPLLQCFVALGQNDGRDQPHDRRRRQRRLHGQQIKTRGYIRQGKPLHIMLHAIPGQ